MMLQLTVCSSETENTSASSGPPDSALSTVADIASTIDEVSVAMGLENAESITLSGSA